MKEVTSIDDVIIMSILFVLGLTVGVIGLLIATPLSWIGLRRLGYVLAFPCLVTSNALYELSKELV